MKANLPSIKETFAICERIIDRIEARRDVERWLAEARKEAETAQQARRDEREISL